MSWRYQPVWALSGGERVYSLCELHFEGDSDRLESWSESPAIIPQGKDMDGLTGDLVRMYVDAVCWEPVEFRTLKPGMTFTRRLSQMERSTMAALFDQWKKPQ